MADARVLEAQKWVNATYAGVPGYNRCPEDGRTAWSTMHSLTRALQHELGITALSDAFGPTTMSKLDARNGVWPGEQNTNIVKIIQSACFSKGYNPGPINGIYSESVIPGANTDKAMKKMTTDMGIGPQDRLEAKT